MAMKTRFIILFTAFLFTLCGNVLAIGLGDITVESGLNEPLKARIALVRVGDMREAELLAGLADTAEFEKLKMSRDAFYTTIRFKVDMKNPAGPSILLTSDAVVKEPSLDFLVTLTWPTGKLVRGYTVLLEKP
jgi:pilus assembly protein FimV